MLVDIIAQHRNGTVFSEQYRTHAQSSAAAVKEAIRQFVNETGDNQDIQQICAVCDGQQHIYSWLEAKCL